jgi:hypothetical protein
MSDERLNRDNPTIRESVNKMLDAFEEFQNKYNKDREEDNARHDKLLKEVRDNRDRILIIEAQEKGKSDMVKMWIGVGSFVITSLSAIIAFFAAKLGG